MLIKSQLRKLTSKVNYNLNLVMIPGGKGISLYTVVSNFRNAISSGSLNTRAASISFKFFLALFPGILFIFTIIPLIPVRDFQINLMIMLKELMPEMLFPLLENTIMDIVSRKHTGLLSLGFLLSLWFSSSMFISIISSFNQSVNISETRSPMQKRFLGIILMLCATLLIIVAITMMAAGQGTLAWLVGEGYIKKSQVIGILPVGRWFLLGFIIYLTISGIYYFAPAKKEGFRFFSAGSLIATLSFVGIAWGFGYFVKYFSTHNALYGSVGTLILFLLYIYYNAIILLVGFELNASIIAAGKKQVIKTHVTE